MHVRFSAVGYIDLFGSVPVTDLETRSGEEPPTPMTPELIPAPIMPGWLARSGVELEKVVVGGWR